MKKYSIRELENLLLQPGIYSFMTRNTHANEFYKHNMKCAVLTNKYNKYSKCSNYDNMAYEIDGYKITKTPGGFVMLWFPDGSRCLNVSQEKLKKLFAKCAMFYTQQETGKINDYLDNSSRIEQGTNGYIVLDYNGAYSIGVQKDEKKYHLDSGLGVHFDTKVIPQEYIRDLYTDVQDVYILQDLLHNSIKSVEKNYTNLELHRNGFETRFGSHGYDIKYVNKTGTYTIRYSFEARKSQYNIGELVLPDGRIISENRKIKTDAMTTIYQNAEQWLRIHTR